MGEVLILAAYPCRLVEEKEAKEVKPKPKLSSVVRLVSQGILLGMGCTTCSAFADSAWFVALV